MDGDTTIDVKVKHKALVGRKLLGVARIPMVDVASGGAGGIQRWFQLLTADNQFEASGTGRGEVNFGVIPSAFRIASIRFELSAFYRLS